MFRVWFERPFPRQFAHLMEGIAEYAGSASETPDAPLSALPGADAIIASSRLHYDGALMDRAPTLRVISRSGIGLDNISVPDATSRGIAVCYAPDAPTVSTAEHAITLLLAVAKDLKRIDLLMRSGTTTDFFTPYNGIEVQGLRLGLVGLGRIGSRVAALGRGLGMTVSAYDPLVPPERATALEIVLVPTLDELLTSSDAVSLHVPLLPDTRHLIDGQRLAQMKCGAILVNAARGGLVDEAALIDALDSGQLHGAGLDVFEQEPPRPDNPLLNRVDVVATPHIASATGKGKDRLWHDSIVQAIQALRGERPPNLVNPEVWPQDRR